MKLLIAALLLTVCFFAISCKRRASDDLGKPTTAAYIISYPDSIFTGDRLSFSCNALPTDAVHWYFGDCIEYTPFNDGSNENYACDSCDGKSPPWIVDTANRLSGYHGYCSPGTYKVVLTVNGDVLHKVTKTVKVISAFTFAINMAGMRHWKRTNTVLHYDTSWISYTDSTYSLPDTNFSIGLCGGYCVTPTRNFSFNSCSSNSSQLYFINPRHQGGGYSDGNVTYNIVSDSVFIKEQYSSGPVIFSYTTYIAGP